MIVVVVIVDRSTATPQSILQDDTREFYQKCQTPAIFNTRMARRTVNDLREANKHNH